MGKRIVFCPKSYACLTEEAVRMIGDVELVEYMDHLNDKNNNPEKYLNDENDIYEWLKNDNSMTYQEKLEYISNDGKDVEGKFYTCIPSEFDRSDEKLIKAVETLGRDAYPHTECHSVDDPESHELVIIELPDDLNGYYITDTECSMGEIVVESHRKWFYNEYTKNIETYKKGE